MCGGRPGTMRVMEHRIEIKKGAKQAFMQPYRMGPAAREKERMQVQNMLEQDVIEPDVSK